MNHDYKVGDKVAVRKDAFDSDDVRGITGGHRAWFFYRNGVVVALLGCDEIGVCFGNEFEFTFRPSQLIRSGDEETQSE